MKRGKNKDSSVINIHPAMRPFTGYCFYRISQRMRGLMDRRLEPHGLVAPQYGMIALINKVGAMTQIELGMHMDIDKATMVRFLDGLEQRKFLIRAPDPNDRRAKVLKLTPTGKKILDELSQIRVEVEQEMFAPLSSEEVGTLRELIAKISLHDRG